MSRGRPFNPNTKYGRRRIKEEFQRRYELKTPEEKKALDDDVTTARWVLFIIIMIVCVIIIAMGGKIK